MRTPLTRPSGSPQPSLRFYSSARTRQSAPPLGWVPELRFWKPPRLRPAASLERRQFPAGSEAPAPVYTPCFLHPPAVRPSALANPALGQCWAARGFWGGDPCSQSFFPPTSPAGVSRLPGILPSMALHWQLPRVFCLIKVSGSWIMFISSALWVPCGGGFS